LHPVAPLTLDRFISRCIAKDPNDRWQAARDLSFELMWIVEDSRVVPIGTYTPPSRKRERVAWATVAMAALIIVAMSFPIWRDFSTSPDPRQIQFVVSTPATGDDVQSRSPHLYFS
jgi:hypothetical protein